MPLAPAAVPSAPSLVERLHAALASSVDARLVERGRFIDLDSLVAIDDEARLLRVRAGRPALAALDRPLQSSVFSIRGSARAWAALWEAEPAPGWHDLFALCKRGEMQIDGNLQPLMANLQWFKDVLALPRAPSP